LDSQSEGFRQDLNILVQAVIAATDASSAVLRAVDVKGDRITIADHVIDIGLFDRICAVAGGKAACGMAQALDRTLGEHLTAGLVCPPHGSLPDMGRFRIAEGGHPYPDAASEIAAREALNLTSALGREDLLIALVSGGLSSIWCSPAEGLSLNDKRQTNELLIGSGANISEINTVRKHLSSIKAGLLAAAAHPATVITLAVSDVVGDDPSSIGSGPTVPDPTTFQDAMSVIKAHELDASLPDRILRRLVAGMKASIPETPKPNDPTFASDLFDIVASNQTAVQAAALAARTLGYDVRMLDNPVVGEARDAAARLCGMSKDLQRKKSEDPRPMLLIGGGETTVKVKGSGQGGRNQEMALSAAIALEGTHGILFASFGTDGIDGCTRAAGAFADSAMSRRAADEGIDLRQFLVNNDSNSVFKKLGGLIETGPTGTNVGDVQLVFIA
jgi:hydroxypyruvate reductase